MEIGIVIQDSHNEVLACRSSSQDFHSQTIIAKSWALQRSVELHYELGFNQVMLEGNAQIIITEIQKEALCDAWYGVSLKTSNMC